MVTRLIVPILKFHYMFELYNWIADLSFLGSYPTKFGISCEKLNLYLKQMLIIVFIQDFTLKCQW